MPYIPQVKVGNTIYNIKDSEARQRINDLSRVMNNINANKPIIAIEVKQAQSIGPVVYTFDTPISSYTHVEIKLDSLNSTDVDSDICSLIVMDEYERQYMTFRINRNEAFEINREYYFPIKTIRLYPSDNYSHSTGDTLTITNLTVSVYNEHYDSLLRANGMLKSSEGHNKVAYSPIFEQIDKIRRSDTIFNNYSFQSMIYVPELEKYYAAGNISAATGESIFASFSNMFDLGNPDDSLLSNMGHCNDMTYNSDNGMIYVIHGGNNAAEGSVSRNGITVIDPSDFTNNYEIIVPEFEEMQSIEYYNGYFYIRQANGIYKCKLNNDRTISPIIEVIKIDHDAIRNAVSNDPSALNFYTYQMITIKNDVLYYLLEYYADSIYKYQAKYTIICKYSILSGDCLGYIVFENDIADEAEAILFVKERLYIVSMKPAYITYYENRYRAEYYPYSSRTLRQDANLNNLLANGEYCIASGDVTVQNLPEEIDISAIRGITVYVSRFRHSDILQRLLVIYNDGNFNEYMRVIKNDGTFLSDWKSRIS